MAIAPANTIPPCLLFEDEHLLVVNKPAGWNTHAPSPYAGEGIYDWLKHREPHWASLAIIHPLDKETSGVLVFGKTPVANRSHTEQFAARTVRKQYVLLTDRKPACQELVVRSKITRVGERYISSARGEDAETQFRYVTTEPTGHYLIEAEPLTGRTHQIRVHATERGFPVLGDKLYGGRAFQRVCLHARSLSFTHPASGAPMHFEVTPKFETHWEEALRAAIIDPTETNAFRVLHRGSLTPGFYLDRLGSYALVQCNRPLSPAAEKPEGYLGTYFKWLTRHVRGAQATDTCPKLIHGQPAPDHFPIRENGVKFELSFHEGYSVGLFLDQRDNRRRCLTGHLAAGFLLANAERGARSVELLNTFAYTCGFSVCAALAGMHTTSLDLSKKYLEWGQRNFVLNGLDPAAHDFIYGDTFDWLKRFAKKQRLFDVVVLDPPTFSQSKASGVFRAEKDYGKLVAAALPVLRPGGVLFASTNAAELAPEKFLADITGAVNRAGRKVRQQHYVPQPPDFPICRAEPAYLKTVWLRVD